MLLTGLREPDAGLWAALSGLVFFAFVSAPAVWRYFNNSVVLSVQPAGIYDARVSAEPLSWENVREIVLRQAEETFTLDIYLWKRQRDASGQTDFQIELASLNSPVHEIVQDISTHMKIRNEAGIAFEPVLQ